MDKTFIFFMEMIYAQYFTWKTFRLKKPIWYFECNVAMFLLTDLPDYKCIKMTIF